MLITATIHMYAHNDSHLPRSHCPVASSNSTQSRDPLQQAICKAVPQPSVCWLMFELCFKSTWAITGLSHRHALCKSCLACPSVPPVHIHSTPYQFFHTLHITNRTRSKVEFSSRCCLILYIRVWELMVNSYQCDKILQVYSLKATELKMHKSY